MQNADLKTKCAQSLISISGSLTTEDKREAAKRHSVHYNTILNYLRGDIGDIDTAIKLIKFFNKKLKGKLDRVKEILST